MDSEEISRIVSELNLSELDCPVAVFEGSSREAGARKVAFSLVGKILATSQVNKEAFKGLIDPIWRTLHGLETEDVGENMFVFHFRAAMDRKKVLSGGTWNFNNDLIVLEEPKGLGDLSKLSFNRASFWIQIHNVPVFCMSNEVGIWLGNMIGDLKDIDFGPSGDCLGKFMWVRVNIDISLPLKRALRVSLDGESVTVLLRYERLPNFCRLCGKLGHVIGTCPNSINGALSSSTFGAWLRAAAPLERSKGHWRLDNKPPRASASKKPDSAPFKSPTKGQPSSGSTMASEDMPDIRDSAQVDHGTAFVSDKGQPSVPDSTPDISAPIIFEDIPGTLLNLNSNLTSTCSETLSMPHIPSSADVCPTPSDSVSSAPDPVKGSPSLVSPKHLDYVRPCSLRLPMQLLVPNVARQKQGRRFCLEPLWLQHDATKEVIARSWLPLSRPMASSVFALNKNLSDCAMALSSWGASEFGSIPRHVAFLRLEIDRLYSAP
ncbi:hypothetical protein ACOSQ4_014106 [Xanthoceras sorbifolium]